MSIFTFSHVSFINCLGSVVTTLWGLEINVQIVELKKQHQAGGRKVYTWMKQPQDKYTHAIGLGLVGLAVVQLIPGLYRLATGKGKKE